MAEDDELSLQLGCDVEVSEAGMSIQDWDKAKEGFEMWVLRKSHEDDEDKDEDEDENDDDDDDDNNDDGPGMYEDISSHVLSKQSNELFFIGMIFKDHKEFKSVVTKYSCEKRVCLYARPNEPSKVKYVCKANNCKWMIYTSKDGTSDSFMVKSLHQEHTCFADNRNKLVTASYIAQHFKTRVISQPNIKIKELVELCRVQLNASVSKAKVKRAKKLVRDMVSGGFKTEYASLWSYAAELMKTNPGTSVKIKVARDEEKDVTHFKRIYICFEACKRGFIEGCRPFIGVDSCFIKHACKGLLASAIARDGNNQNFPLAWAVIETESKDSWTWFFENLLRDIGFKDGEGLTIMSDMHLGILSAVQTVLPKAEHKLCTRHIYANWSKNHRGGQMKMLFYKLARSTYHEQFEDNLAEMESISPQAKSQLMEYKPEKWSKAYMLTTSQCDVIDNNMCESFNSWILDARVMSIVSMLNHIRLMVMHRLHENRSHLSSWRYDVSPNVMQIIEETRKYAYYCGIEWNGDAGYEISDNNEKHVVNLRNKSCSCKEWSISGIPCKHALRAIDNAGKNIEDFVSYWYKKDRYLKSYANSMEPIHSERMWPPSNLPIINPPIFKRMAGRPKKNRRKDRDEPSKNYGKMSRKGRTMHCSVCGSSVHNKRGCKQQGQTSSTNSINLRGPRVFEGMGIYQTNNGVTIENPGRPKRRRIATVNAQTSQTLPTQESAS